MATIKKEFVFAITILSGIAILITIVCLATEQWIYSDKISILNLDSGQYNHVKYGLFQGTYRQYFPTTGSFQVEMTCLANENVCALICADQAANRYSILKDLHEGKVVNGTTSYCTQILSNRVAYNTHIVLSSSTDTPNQKYINFGVWICTILFLVISITFGFISATLSLYNTVSNPVQVYLSIYGIYVYLFIACSSSILAVLLWGVHYNKDIFHNVALLDTLNGDMSSDKTAVLGYSYWLNLVPVLLYIASICVLYARQYLISRDPKQQIVQRDETGDPRIYLY